MCIASGISELRNLYELDLFLSIDAEDRRRWAVVSHVFMNFVNDQN